MLGFLTQNAGNIVIGLGVLALIVTAALQVRRARKRGGCGCGCEGCSSACHPKK